MRTLPHRSKRDLCHDTLRTALDKREDVYQDQLRTAPENRTYMMAIDQSDCSSTTVVTSLYCVVGNDCRTTQVGMTAAPHISRVDRNLITPMMQSSTPSGGGDDPSAYDFTPHLHLPHTRVCLCRRAVFLRSNRPRSLSSLSSDHCPLNVGMHFCCNVIAIRSDEFYILLASDGLWDVVRFPFKFLPPQLAV